MNVALSKEEIEKIRENVKKEFPHDMALQEIHIARRIIAREVQESGGSYYQYIQKWKKETEKERILE